MSLESNLSAYIKDRGYILKVVAEKSNINYMSLYDSLFNAKSNRKIRGTELIKLCRFLEKDPEMFMDDEAENEQDLTDDEEERVLNS